LIEVKIAAAGQERAKPGLGGVKRGAKASLARAGDGLKCTQISANPLH
jgi:hypothetical protein